MKLNYIIIFSIALAINFARAQQNIEISLIHINDFHARFEETNNASQPCGQGQNCIGGYARMATIVRQLRQNRPNPIFLNAGDNFSGTNWYSLFRYNVTSRFLNLLPADAMTIGNLDFAHNVEGLVPFLRRVTSPVVAANIDASNEPSIRGLFKKSIVITRSGRRIGIVGAIYSRTAEIALTGRLRFTDEVAAIRNEALALRRQGINIIIALTHCGIFCDMRIAREAGDIVDVIVGGHTHSFLFSSSNGNFPGQDRNPAGSYPTIVQVGNRRVLIVQAFAFTRYVGDLRITFDANGNLRSFNGNPIYLGPNVRKDPQIVQELAVWRQQVDIVSRRVVGRTNVDLLVRPCMMQECIVGSFTADGILRESSQFFRNLNIRAAIVHAGGMRGDFMTGPITFGNILTFMPFTLTFDYLALNGRTIREVFEHSVSRPWTTVIGPHFLQVSGIQVAFNMARPEGSRITSIRIRNNNGQFENLVATTTYGIIVPSFLANGGDGYSMIARNKQNHQTGLLDIDIVETIIARSSPITFRTDGRISVINF